MALMLTRSPTTMMMTFYGDVDNDHDNDHDNNDDLDNGLVVNSSSPSD